MRTDQWNGLNSVREQAQTQLRSFGRRPGIRYADLHFELNFNRYARAENGALNYTAESEEAEFSVRVHYQLSESIIGQGQCGLEIGADFLRNRDFARVLLPALEAASERARLNAYEKDAMSRQSHAIAAALAMRPVPRREPITCDLDAVYLQDPRDFDPNAMDRLCEEASHAVTALDRRIAFNIVAAMTEYKHDLYADSAGTVVTQSFAASQRDCYVVANGATGAEEIYDSIGQCRGPECLMQGHCDGPASNPDLQSFALSLGREAMEIADAPVVRPPEREVTVVTDPHFNSLLCHEIVGHACEADRALKMETAYAGRTWLYRSRQDNELGRTIGSRLLSACSDPSIDAFGHYRYDHEGTAGRRVDHIRNGTLIEFLNSRWTANVLGVAPNGSARASRASFVPLVRMSNTYFLPGDSDPQKIIGEVNHGYYLCGRRVPSITESRETFRISARRVYEIRNGRLGQLYRNGSITADSGQFFMHVDGVGNDLQLFPIPNCSKGQPVQSQRMANGGPTLRSRATLVGG